LYVIWALMALLMLRSAAAAALDTCAALPLTLLSPLPPAPSSLEQSSVSTSDAARFFFLPLPADAEPFLAALPCRKIQGRQNIANVMAWQITWCGAASPALASRALL
jgi:hypothetical protein